METTPVSAWIAQDLLEELRRLQQRRPHAPPLKAVAAACAAEGIAALEGNDQSALPLGATPGSPRCSISVRLPNQLHRRLLTITKQIPDATTPSAALHLALWVGVAKLLEDLVEQEAGQAA